MPKAMTDSRLGEFEQAVLLSILREGRDAFAMEVRRSLEKDSGKPVSRGAYYATVERLKRKGLLTWESARPANSRRVTKQRRFSLTPEGVQALKDVRQSLRERWVRLDQAFGES
jgi:PadR family transcriptional regulator PadR